MKMVLTMPQTVDAKKFALTVFKAVCRRYKGERKFFKAALQAFKTRENCGLIKSGVHYTFCEVDAAKVDPAIISAIHDLKKFLKLNIDVDFRVNGLSIKFVHDDDWWKPNDIEMAEYGFEFEQIADGRVIYDENGARHARKLYNYAIDFLESVYNPAYKEKIA